MLDLNFPTRNWEEFPVPSAVEAWNSNLWTTREVPILLLFFKLYHWCEFLVSSRMAFVCQQNGFDRYWNEYRKVRDQDTDVQCESENCSVVSNSLLPHGLCSWWNSPEQNSGVGSLSLLEGNFPTQGSNPGLSHCRQILYQLSHKGRPRIVEWVAYPLSSGFSQPRSWTSISCIAGGIFTNWAIREALIFNYGCVTQV